MGDPSSWCVYLLCLFFLVPWLILIVLLTLCDFSSSVVKECPELESQFKERVQEVIKYARTIDDFDKLVDPRTLAHHCLGLEPSLYIFQAIEREQRKRELS